MVGVPAFYQFSIDKDAVLQEEIGQDTAILVVFFSVELQADPLLKYQFPVEIPGLRAKSFCRSIFVGHLRGVDSRISHPPAIS